MAFSLEATPVPPLHQAPGATNVLRSMMEQMVQEAVEREFWTLHRFREMTGHGLEGVEYVVSDEHMGLLEAVQRYFPAAEHERQVHYLRNALAHAGSEALGQELKTAPKDAWAAPDRAQPEAQLARLIDRLELHAR